MCTIQILLDLLYFWNFGVFRWLRIFFFYNIISVSKHIFLGSPELRPKQNWLYTFICQMLNDSAYIYSFLLSVTANFFLSLLSVARSFSFVWALCLLPNFDISMSEYQEELHQLRLDLESKLSAWATRPTAGLLSVSVDCQMFDKRTLLDLPFRVHQKSCPNETNPGLC